LAVPFTGGAVHRNLLVVAGSANDVAALVRVSVADTRATPICRPVGPRPVPQVAGSARPIYYAKNIAAAAAGATPSRSTSTERPTIRPTAIVEYAGADRCPCIHCGRTGQHHDPAATAAVRPSIQTLCSLLCRQHVSHAHRCPGTGFNAADHPGSGDIERPVGSRSWQLQRQPITADSIRAVGSCQWFAIFPDRRKRSAPAAQPHAHSAYACPRRDCNALLESILLTGVRRRTTSCEPVLCERLSGRGV